MFETRLASVAAKVQAFLDAEFDRQPDPDRPLVQAMRYAVTGGKRLRAFLAIESARLHGVPEAVSIYPAAAIEAMHAYSLVHDDLPCMDDDDLRRGLPTVHRKWDQATAVLAGDALQALAFDLVCRTPVDDPRIIARLAGRLATASGMAGMVQGQMMDIAAETAAVPLTLDQITELQACKTGALISWSSLVGAQFSLADDAAMRIFADRLGLAFQIADDILDAEGDPAKTGKALRKDAAAGKATFVSLLGLTGARARAAELVDDAIAALAPYGPRADTLRDCARYVVSRDR